MPQRGLFAAWVLEHVRDVDVTHSRPVTRSDLYDGVAGLRRRVRDPGTLLLLSQRVL